MTRIKICGITKPEDGAFAARAGAEAVGVVFYPPSPRAVTLEQARAVSDALPPFTSLVALFVNPSVAEVEQALKTLPISLLQFHGDESPAFCEQFDRPYMKAVRVRGPDTVTSAFDHYDGANGLLLDAYVKDQYGGTGQPFNWDWIPRERPLPVVLAGGLTSDNVAGAVRAVRPWAVDVSGGVEASKGIKDPDKIRQFINEVRSVVETD
ncbi:phosphoribosylanthranilate isomerase [Marinobacteraceae bacterium S3BR75-40.1]